MSDGDTPSQVTEPAQTAVSHETPVPQAPVATDSPPPGAETTAEPAAPAPVAKDQPTPPSKTYTQAEWDAQQAQLLAVKDREIQQHKEALAQIAMREQIAQVQAAEAQAKAKDQADADAGLITQDDVARKAQARAATLQAYAEAHQARQVRDQAITQVDNELLIASALHIAREVASKEGLNRLEMAELFDQLLMGDRPKSPEALRLKASELRRQKIQDALRAAKAKPETFDKGPQAETTGPATEDQRLRARYPSMFK